MRNRVLIDSIHADVISRDNGIIPVFLSCRVELTSKNKRVAKFKYRLAVSSKNGQITMSGSLELEAEDDQEEKDLEEVIESIDKNSCYHPIVYYLLVQNLLPVMLFVEKELGLPLTPIPPVPPKCHPADNKNGNGQVIYQ